MCSGSPSIPTPTPPPPPPQDAKAPDMNAIRKRNNTGGSGGSLLTGPAGIANNAISTGSKSLLGS